MQVTQISKLEQPVGSADSRKAALSLQRRLLLLNLEVLGEQFAHSAELQAASRLCMHRFTTQPRMCTVILHCGCCIVDSPPPPPPRLRAPLFGAGGHVTNFRVHSVLP